MAERLVKQLACFRQQLRQNKQWRRNKGRTLVTDGLSSDCTSMKNTRVLDKSKNTNCF